MKRDPDQHVAFFVPMTDAELELHIKHCGDLMQQEHAAGNIEAAENWLQAMNEAIRARSPTQIMRMEAALGLAEEAREGPR